ncbi:Alb1p NDAI_0G06090 [Naumovozyma dairenensis CBS 421]|uniref:Ribosome biogenesis protein ALB1 n=1 Tax=Naumovozyma dairenensis (strain ATCC 10597 / BCRC 20456 / CBS 421 / NBRC 0211 / NRRL Y-12639) TaxID=1071378 RepID=J7RTM6_NAUDC|nr:hypothetical protein NDAI_0G06090 [Naumovozyma dairenensis CBS 421]CCK73592.1 hypothetical protein NDAI_0G06090 [Naumovozyma dairenensis CBS 421]
MPSKNSINRPKLTVNLHRKAQKAGKKRAARERAGHYKPARSADASKSGEIKSVALDLYFNDKDKTGQASTNTSTLASGNGSVTTKTLSKKRAKKIERSLRYAEQRKLLIDLQAKLENGNDDTAMDVDGGEVVKRVRENKKEKSALTQMKEALWNVLDDASSSQGLVIGSGQGTTLGGPFFP